MNVNAATSKTEIKQTFSIYVSTVLFPFEVAAVQRLAAVVVAPRRGRG